ncbi:MAG: hypothetical protein LBM78_01980 [Clostridiales bacterium]|jgi:sporulation protein YlmC with PRC-barrel domain|nr:hypothetical protein [Clostridiales bacterium]
MKLILYLSRLLGRTVTSRDGTRLGVVKNVSFAADLSQVQWVIVFRPRGPAADAAYPANAFTAAEDGLILAAHAVPLAEGKIGILNPLNARLHGVDAPLPATVTDVALDLDMVTQWVEVGARRLNPSQILVSRNTRLSVRERRTSAASPERTSGAAEAKPRKPKPPAAQDVQALVAALSVLFDSQPPLLPLAAPDAQSETVAVAAAVGAEGTAQEAAVPPPPADEVQPEPGAEAPQAAPAVEVPQPADGVLPLPEAALPFVETPQPTRTARVADVPPPVCADELPPPEDKPSAVVTDEAPPPAKVHPAVAADLPQPPVEPLPAVAVAEPPPVVAAAEPQPSPAAQEPDDPSPAAADEIPPAPVCGIDPFPTVPIAGVAADAFFPDTPAVGQKPRPGAAAGSPRTIIGDFAFLLGRVLGADLAAPSGALIQKKDSVVTPFTVFAALNHNLLFALMLRAFL